MTARRIAAILTLASLLLSGSAGMANGLYLIRPDGADLTPLTEDGGHNYGSPDWSPDGRRIAFDSIPKGGEFETTRLVVVDSDPDSGNPPTQLGAGAMPSWSPDGTQIVCHTYPANNADNLHHVEVVNADGSGREAVLEEWGSPRWAPDGRRIVTVRGGGLAAYDLATGTQTVLLNGGSVRNGLIGGYVQLGFSISPDGKRYGVALSQGGFAFAVDDPVNGGLRLKPRVAAPAVFRHSSWSPDGERLVAMARSGLREKEPSRLVLFDADGDTPPAPLPGIPEHWRCSDPDWSPDGEWIVFAGWTDNP